MYIFENLQEKWQVRYTRLLKISDAYKEDVLAVIES